MRSKIDVWEAAQLLIAAHGEAAPIAAAAEINRHLGAGDLETARAWNAVRLAIDELTERTGEIERPKQARMH